MPRTTRTATRPITPTSSLHLSTGSSDFNLRVEDEAEFEPEEPAVAVPEAALAAEPEPETTGVIMPEQWGQGVEAEPQLELNQQSEPAPLGEMSAANDPIQALHACNNQLADLLLELPLSQMRRTLNSAMGPVEASQWLTRVESAKRQHQI